MPAEKKGRKKVKFGGWFYYHFLTGRFYDYSSLLDEELFRGRQYSYNAENLSLPNSISNKRPTDVNLQILLHRIWSALIMRPVVLRKT